MSDSNISVLFKGEYKQENVTLAEVASSRIIDPVLEAKCKAEWERSLEQARKEGKKRFEGETYRFESIEQHPGELSITMSTIPFSIRSSMNVFKDDLSRLGFTFAARGLFTSNVVITSDEKYVFIEDSGLYLNRRPIMFIGGVLSKSEKELHNGADLFEQARQECKEEVGCIDEDFTETKLIAGYITNSSSVCLLFKIRLSITFDELQERFNADNDGEAKNILGVSSEKIVEFGRTLDEKEHPKFWFAGLV
jgi:hypothetical protein